jgi:putative transposase
VARLRRLAAAGHCHLVVQPLLPGRTLAADVADLAAWGDALREQAATERVRVLGWALAPGSLWLLLEPETAEGVGRLMQGLGRRVVAPLNRRLGQAGPAWAGRFRAAIVEPGPWRLAATLWVDSRAESPAFGSGAARTGQAARPPWLLDPPELWALGNTPFERESRWAQRLEAGLPADQADRLARGASGCWAVGSAGFAATLAEQLGRPTSPRSPGRPARQARRAPPAPSPNHQD